MTKNEIVARWTGHQPTKEGYYWISYDNIGEVVCYHPAHLKFDSDRNWLHEAWIKFRDLKFEDMDLRILHNSFKIDIMIAICKLSITEAFDELVKGINWYNSIKQ